MESLLETNHLIDVAIAVFLGYMAWKMRKVETMSVDIAVIKSVVEHLPIQAMQSDITSNRHKITSLDKTVAKDIARLGERLNSIEGKCAFFHKDDIVA